MELVKKNILSIICGVVALAAIIFHLVYTSSGFSELEKKGQERAAKEAELKQLVEGDYRMPAASIEGEPTPLDRFPNELVIKAAQGIVGKLAKQADTLVKEAVAINRTGYNVIVPDALPSPADPVKYRFREQYNAVLARGGQPRAFDPKNPVQNLPDGVLKSAVPPTDQEILTARLDKWEKEYRPKLILVNNQPVNQKEVVSEFLKNTANFDLEFRRNRAMQFKVYLNPLALTLAPAMDMAARTAPSVDDIWFSQMSLWIQQDVCNAIARMNAASNSIPTSPVKHLVAVDVKHDASMYVLPGGLQMLAPGAVPAPAAPVPTYTEEYVDEGSGEGGEGGEGGDPFAGDPFSAPAAPAAQPKNYALSPTGRVSPTPPAPGLYDVVHFEFVVVLDREKMRDFIRQVQSGRLITVLEADLQHIDLNEAVSQGYDYGFRPVVEVRMKCEALFLREWTVQNNGPMPYSVRAMLGIPATPAAPPTAVAQQ